MKGEWFDPRKEFGKAVSEAAERDDRIVVISADSGKSSGFGTFAEQHPERYFEVGIMEQCAVGIASGLATTGKIPVFCAIAPFVTARPFEMVRNDLGYMGQNVKIIGRNCGITYSDLGATHHSLDDFALMRMIPGMTILAPQDPMEIRTAADAMLRHTGPVYMRIGNQKIPQLFEEKPFVIGKGQVLQDGEDLTIISTGTETGYVLAAAEMLRGQGVRARVIGLPTVFPLDEDLILESVQKTGGVMTVEEHYLQGGLGAAVSELLSERRPVPVRRLGVPHVYVTSGKYEELLHYYQLDAEEVCQNALAFLKTIK